MLVQLSRAPVRWFPRQMQRLPLCSLSENGVPLVLPHPTFFERPYRNTETATNANGRKLAKDGSKAIRRRPVSQTWR
jgi:hypothetical protein